MVYSSDFHTSESYRQGYSDAMAVNLQFHFDRKDRKKYENNDMYRKGYDQGELDAKQSK